MKFDLEGILGLMMVILIPNVDEITSYVKIAGIWLGAVLVILSIIHKVLEIRKSLKEK